MSFFISQSRAVFLKPAAFAAAFSMLASQALAQHAGAGPFQGLAGYWSGGGTVAMSNGATERIRCKATYAVSGSGSGLNQSLRCASDSYTLDISSNVAAQGGAISGTWRESAHNAAGSISGRASSADIEARVAGAGFSASLNVRTHGDRQTVAITPQGTNVRHVSISLRKG